MATNVSASIYDGMDGAARTVAQEAVIQITALQRNMVADIAEIGKSLLRVKEAVGHGSFLPWLKAEFGWTERTAQNYMSVAERLGEKYETVSHLPLKTIYALASPSTPDELRDGVVAKLEKGEPVEPGEVASEIRDVRLQARRLAEEEERVARRNPKLNADQVKAKVRRTKEEKQAQWESELAERARQEALKLDAIEQFVVSLDDDQRAMLVSLIPFQLYHSDFVRVLQRMGEQVRL